jgi:hypothetical protein
MRGKKKTKTILKSVSLLPLVARTHAATRIMLGNCIGSNGSPVVTFDGGKQKQQ